MEHKPMMGICAHEGATPQELEALKPDLYHNWGSGHILPAGPGRVLLYPLSATQPPIGVYGAKRLLFSNEPNNPDLKAGDGYYRRPRAAGRKAASLYLETHPDLAVFGNFFAGDWESPSYPGSCYDGTRDTIEAGPRYWDVFRDGCASMNMLPQVYGIHYIWREEPMPDFDPHRVIDLLVEFHDWAGTDVWLTELGCNVYRFNIKALKLCLTTLLAWAETAPWLKAIFWSEFPSRYSDSGLWRPSGITDLGKHWLKLHRGEIELPEEPGEEEPDEEEGETVIEANWEDQNWRYEVLVKRQPK